MRFLIFVTVGAVLCSLLAAASLSVDPPTFPDQYYLDATFSLPYADIVEPLYVFYDAPNHRERIGFYEDLDWFLYRYDMNQAYSIYTAMDHQECKTVQPEGNDNELVSILPTNISSWSYMGNAEIRGLTCQHFQLVKKNQDKVNTYDFYYVMKGDIAVPVQWHMLGYDVVFGSHYDEYVLDYGKYLPGVATPSAFDIPSMCNSAKVADSPARVNRGKLSLKMMFPSALGSDLYDSFAMKHEKQTSKKGQSNFESNVEMINRHNARNDVSFEMEINRFADMDFDEFHALYLNHKKSNGIPAHSTHKPSLDLSKIAENFDWRDHGAVTDIKDQGACGSCWSFSTTGTLEGAYYLKHGKLIPFSEQNLVDCSWEYGGNAGCDGGLPWAGLQYIIDHGGLNTEQKYGYFMQDGYCRFEKSSAMAQVSSYVNVTEGDENALLDALTSKGPISVGIDVVESFIFYSSGVYYDPACKSGMEDMLHSVLVTGYGTENGQDYWLVKNSWSTHWGDNGYVKMARNRDNNCGIATQAVYPVMV